MIGKNCQKDEASLYIHVPFCSKKCPYCHFFVLPDSVLGQSTFTDAVIKEWLLQKHSFSDKTLVSIYLGGGTPSLLSTEHLKRILEAIASSRISIDPNCEITIEANPESITRKQLLEYKDLGINRISFGAQSFDDSLLTALGRTHQSKGAVDAVFSAFEAGIHNISIDLMYELPFQTWESWVKTLQIVESLPITHLSLYNLTFEPGTVFFKKKSSLTPHLPSNEEALSMLNYIVNNLQKKGWERYEISAFAKESLISRHNSGYWTARPFLGLGPSAFSYWDHKRFSNVPHLGKYVASIENGEIPIHFEESLLPEERVRELLAVALRMTQGVQLSSFQEKHGSFSSSLCKTIDALITKGWLQNESSTLSLTEQGFLFYDSVATELI